MKHHFENMKFLYGENISVQLPNSIFLLLAKNTKDSRQASFCYAYLVAVASLYKYAHYVDLDKKTYIQNSDIKQLLGYSKTTKSIDYLIKKDGVLDSLGLTETTKDYPIRFDFDKDDDINGIHIREFTTINDCDDEYVKSIVKNRNYTVKEPLFLTTGYDDRDFGTLYSLENTHEITINEIMMMFTDLIDTLDFMIYAYLKSMCKGMKKNKSRISLETIYSDTYIPSITFYRHIKNLENNNLLNVLHQGWKAKDYSSNEYIWMGI